MKLEINVELNYEKPTLFSMEINPLILNEGELISLWFDLKEDLWLSKGSEYMTDAFYMKAVLMEEHSKSEDGNYEIPMTPERIRRMTKLFGERFSSCIEWHYYLGEKPALKGRKAKSIFVEELR